jgi:hypothetical protein
VDTGTGTQSSTIFDAMLLEKNKYRTTAYIEQRRKICSGQTSKEVLLRGIDKDDA